MIQVRKELDQYTNIIISMVLWAVCMLLLDLVWWLIPLQHRDTPLLSVMNFEVEYVILYVRMANASK